MRPRGSIAACPATGGDRSCSLDAVVEPALAGSKPTWTMPADSIVPITKAITCVGRIMRSLLVPSKHGHVNYPRRSSMNHTGSSAALVADEWAGFEAPLRRATWKLHRCPKDSIASLTPVGRTATLVLAFLPRTGIASARLGPKNSIAFARLCREIHLLAGVGTVVAGEGGLATLACACAAEADGRLKATASMALITFCCMTSLLSIVRCAMPNLPTSTFWSSPRNWVVLATGSPLPLAT